MATSDPRRPLEPGRQSGPIHLSLILADGIGADAELFLLANPVEGAAVQPTPSTGAEFAIEAIHVAVASETVLELHSWDLTADPGNEDQGSIYTFTCPAGAGVLPLPAGCPLGVGVGRLLALTIDTTAKMEVHVFGHWEVPAILPVRQ